MNQTMLILMTVTVAVLAAMVGVLWKRLERLRRRARRSMLVGPESFLRLQKQLYDNIVAASCERAGIQPRLAAEFRSEWGEDTLIYELFRESANPPSPGVYIEVGALDGKRNSVSWIFDALHWRGLLVEAIPERAEECRRNRPGAKVVHAALGPPGAKGTTSFMVPQHDDHQLSAFRENQAVVHEHIAGLEKAGARLRRVEVPYMTMNDALREAGFERVDFASIDVEGGELDLLKGFDLQRYQPRVLIVEDLTLGDDSTVAEYVKSQGYRQVLWIGANRVFVRSTDVGLLQRAERCAETVYSPFVRPKGQPETATRNLR